ncbi:hypothetical protein [Streptomyces sp. BPTC-684]|uniref:hypothetical protein n=1 Tax=Streptomyces sp. BPTC-684 TaxID=3043734 RepID=UPI0024B1D645|nr:hypothetical protein [Streptomyces sp. BPTC-684]WHM37070.1 hypothetical protein QIY60_09285 [Streptomyces sp. BPTC-684]
MPDRRDQPFAERQSPATTDSTDPTNPGARGEDAGQAQGGTGGDSTGGGPDRAPADDNPFAPPPEGRPDQPWRPRRPADGSSPWGSQWSSRQPGPGQGGFGNRPEDPERGSGPGPGPGQNPPPGPALRWDPTDPAQRRARYALLSGMWAFFFALFDMTEIALLLGSLALYWAISSLRAKPKPPETAPAHPASAPPPPPAKPQTTAAVTGLVTAILSLSIVAATFTMQLVYRDYYTCVDDALTKTGSLACNDLLPDPLVPLFGVKE